MRHKIRNLVLAASFAIGVTAAGGAAVSAHPVAVDAVDPTPAGGGTQTTKAVNDDVEAGQQTQIGEQETGDINHNQEIGEIQAGVQESGEKVNDDRNDGATGESGDTASH